MQYLGLSDLEDSGIRMMFFFKTDYSNKFSTERKVRRIILDTLKKNKIEIPYNHITIVEK